MVTPPWRWMAGDVIRVRAFLGPSFWARNRLQRGLKWGVTGARCAHVRWVEGFQSMEQLLSLLTRAVEGARASRSALALWGVSVLLSRAIWPASR